MMKVTFRADASLQIGTGHVMRCVTLADALVAQGATCQFICRSHDGNLIEYIRSNGYVAHALPVDAMPDACTNDGVAPELAHSHWLGSTQAQDGKACASILAAQPADWLIVDHYALDARWERALAPHCRKLMVIDDLADRTHACDLLLDQTVCRDAGDYHALAPESCRLLCGSQYALLRPQFAALRPYSLQRRSQPTVREVLITMGGVDRKNVTSAVLLALRGSPLPAECRITVVMGATAPWLEDVRKQAQDMPWPVRILVGVSDMAQLMADSDLAIGAAGATSWERCCLGVPTILFVLADNQRKIAEALNASGAVHLVDASTLATLPEIVSKRLDSQALGTMSAAAAAIVDGLGVARVIENLINVGLT